MEAIPLIAVSLKGLQTLYAIAEELSRAGSEIDNFLRTLRFVVEKLKDVREMRIRLRNKLLKEQRDSAIEASSLASWDASIVSRRLQAVLRKEVESWEVLVQLDNNILIALDRGFKKGQIPRRGRSSWISISSITMKMVWSGYLKKDAYACIPDLQTIGRDLEDVMDKDIQMDYALGKGMRKAVGTGEANNADKFPAFAMTEVGEALDEAAIMLEQAHNCSDNNDDVEAGITDGIVDGEAFEE